MSHNGQSRSKAQSAVCIARLLGTEGYTEHTANEVKRYWMHRSGLTDRQRSSITRLKDSFGSIMANLSEGERLIVGKYFGLLMRQQFDTGLKIGLQAFATLNGHEIDLESHTPPLVKEKPTVQLEIYKTVKGDLRKTKESLKEKERMIDTMYEIINELPAPIGNVVIDALKKRAAEVDAECVAVISHGKTEGEGA